MRVWVQILFFLSATAMASGRVPAASSISVERLVQWVRDKSYNSLDEAAANTPAAKAKPAAALASSPPLPSAPKVPTTALGIGSTTNGAAAQPGMAELKTEYDDTQARKQNVEAGQYDRNSEGGASHKGVETKVTGSRGKAKPFKKWYPLCLFFDPSVKNANQITKGLTDMAAKCSVNLITYPVFISNSGGNIATLMSKAKEKCNATDGFGQLGINRASAVLVTGDTKLPLQMCNASGASAKDISHCGQMGWNVGDSLEGRLSPTGRWGGFASGMAFGVVAAKTVEGVAAVLGQTILGLPPGYGAGNGTGQDDEGYASAGSSPEPGWSKYGCDKFQETAFDNKNNRWKYLEDQKFYAVRSPMGKLYDLLGGKALFNKPKAPPPPGAQASSSKTNGGADPATGTSSGGATPIVRSTSPAVATFSQPTPASSGNSFSGAGHKQEKKGADTGGGGGNPDRRQLADGSKVRNSLLVTESSEETGSSSGTSRQRPLAEAGVEGTSKTVYYDDNQKRPSATAGGAAGTTQIAGAAALPSQLSEELPTEGEAKARGDRQPASVRPIDSSWVMDSLNKILNIRRPAGPQRERHPRVVQ